MSEFKNQFKILIDREIQSLRNINQGEINQKIELPQRIDVALWKDTKGVWQGVLQDYEGEVSADLAALCKHWTRLQVPEPLKE